MEIHDRKSFVNKGPQHRQNKLNRRCWQDRKYPRNMSVDKTHKNVGIDYKEMKGTFGSKTTYTERRCICVIYLWQETFNCYRACWCVKATPTESWTITKVVVPSIKRPKFRAGNFLPDLFCQRSIDVVVALSGIKFHQEI